MTNSKKYVDNVLIDLKRTHSKDEVISALYKRFEEKDIEIGKLKSEIDYLNSELEKRKLPNFIHDCKEIDKEAKILLRKEPLYMSMKNKVESYRKKNKAMQKTITDLIKQLK